MIPAYMRIARGLGSAIKRGALRPGDRVMSARQIAQMESVSVPTAVNALRVLEADGLVVARPRSGFFVAQPPSVAPSRSPPPTLPQSVTIAGLARTLFVARAGELVPLGAALPEPSWLPVGDLQRVLNVAARRIGCTSQTYSVPPGRLDLRRQLAKRATRWGGRFGPEDMLVTAGETQAMHLALRVTCKPGDIVAVESPCYFGMLLMLESMGLRALEVATDPVYGLDLESLERMLRQHRVAAVLLSPTAQNPTGATMPVDAKRRLVQVLAKSRIPLIEDDIYGDLCATEPRSPPCKAFDETDNVLYCSSISKTLAPGWRVGWIAGGRFHEALVQARLQEALAGAPLFEAALADYLRGSDYDRHLIRLRNRVSGSVRAVATRAEATFPVGTRVGYPRDGFLLWVELPTSCDALNVHARALAEDISVSPGHLFSPQSRFTNYLRLNCANEPTSAFLGAVEKIGQICKSAF
jgi:DNA-binding transcriptional MocR family regulator